LGRPALDVLSAASGDRKSQNLRHVGVDADAALMRPVDVMASLFADQESLAHPHAAKRPRRATRTVGRGWTILFVALASAGSVACHPGTPEPAPSSPVAPERQGAA